MAELNFSDDPATPLNQKIKEINNALTGCPADLVKFGMIRDICRDIYKIGFNDGQDYVLELRQIDRYNNGNSKNEIKT